MKQRLLFVDDEPMVLQGLRRMLWTMREEWDMEFVTSGPEAVAALDASRFDVVVTDLLMAGMSGVELLEVVRARHPDVVRFVLSGQASEEAWLGSVGLAHQFVTKPCDGETLRTTIRRTFAIRKILKSDGLRDLVSRVGTLPSPPAVHRALLRELRSADPSLRRVGDVIASDPAMTAKVLQLVNSAIFGIHRTISDAYQATMILGLKTISALVLSVHVFAEFEEVPPRRLRLGTILPHSVQTATLARTIGLELTGDRSIADDCYAAGLLHDVGKLVLAGSLPARQLEVVATADASGQPLADVERALLGSTHAEVGGYLLGLWGLPEQVVEAVAFHHTPADAGGSSSVALTAAHVANVLEHESRPELLVGGRPALDADYLLACGIDQQIARWRQGAVVA